MEISNIQDFENERQNPSSEGKVFKVSKQVFDHYVGGLKNQAIRNSEIKQIEQMLGGSLGQGSGWGLTRSCTCGACGHVFSFGDHVRSAIKSGIHTADEILGFLNGVDYLLTVDTLKTRNVECVKCGGVIVTPHCCYTSNRYAYV
ncbi:hypothetical protein [Pseudomonas abietaniphila]|uniref:hypothetical protein n=1 Tax=Pseudomonas abietaniphila TaxID=89065 RepID=UPI0007819B39|nr:hypothetical protein [Pseudomonas abietaniphila]